MSPREFRPNEVSSGGVVMARTGDGLRVCLINDGRYWGLPKGNVESGESPEEAALREVQEEVGLPLDAMRIVAPLPASEYVYKRGGRLIFKRVHYFLIETPDASQLRPDAKEVTDARWCTLDDAQRLASFDDTVKAVQAALRLVSGDQAGASAAAP